MSASVFDIQPGAGVSTSPPGSGFWNQAGQWASNAGNWAQAHGQQAANMLNGPMGQAGAAGAAGMQVAPPALNSQGYLTPDMLQAAINQNYGYNQDINRLYGTPSYAAGASVQQAQQMSPQEIKAEQYTAYLISTGMSPQAAQAKTQKVIANPNIKFADDPKFLKYIKQGNAQGLKIGPDGKIQAQTKYTPGGVDLSPESQALNRAFQGLSGEAFGAASGLPGMIGMDTARALAQKQQLAGLAGNMLGQGFTETGLTPSEQAQLNAIQNGYYQQYGDLFNKTMQQATGDLQNSGFTSSNLASKSLQDGAYNAQSRFLTEALSGLAGKEQDLINQRFSRQTGNLNNVLNAYNMLGQNTGLGGLTQGILNPNQAGLFNDPQAAQFAANLQQQNIANRFQNQALTSGIMTQPVTLTPTAGGGGGPGIMDRAGGALSGAASGAAIGSIVPGIGTAIGAGIGGLIGAFKG